jgi:hypothetical protein
MTHARIWAGAVVVVGLLGVLGLSGSLERDTFQNSPSRGILGLGGAAFVVQDTIMQNQERG